MYTFIFSNSKHYLCIKRKRFEHEETEFVCLFVFFKCVLKPNLYDYLSYFNQQGKLKPSLLFEKLQILTAIDFHNNGCRQDN